MYRFAGTLVSRKHFKKDYSGQSKWNISAPPNVTTAPPVSNLKRCVLMLSLLSRTILDQLIKVLVRHLWNTVVYCRFNYIALLHPRLSHMNALRIPNPHVAL